ncbi:MAG TPA: hypothetical protein DD444_24090 [Citreicella sp.]|jgi:hypothetical protein|nr:hypothetical protein [Citreicella sp.]HBT03119.1 hypothetical protein [Citreicella sp.]
MHLPPFTYHVLARREDGPPLTCGHDLDRESAFDCAVRLIRDDHAVRVEMIQRNPATGGALQVSDVTALMLWERDLPLDLDTAAQPEPLPIAAE